MAEKVTREIRILKFLRHPHIVSMYEVIDTHTDVFLVMEYVPGGELFDYIVEKGQLPESEARRFFQQLVSGIECCHLNDIVHRDLKPENLLLDSHNNIKIADFGFANIVRDGYIFSTSCGSKNYAAPEIIEGKMYSGPEVDIWSCGVILFALAYGRLPFDEESIPLLFKRIKSADYDLRPTISFEARSMISRLLVVNPLKRATIAEIREHIWFQTALPQYLSEPWKSNSAHGLKSFGHVPSAACACEHDEAVTCAILDRQELSKQASNDQIILREKSLMVPLPERTTLAFASLEPIMPYTGMFNVNRRIYAIGIRCKTQPAQFMLQIYGVLGQLEFDWKTLNPYKLRCRWISGAQKIKIGLQLFQVQESMYLLDFQNISGHPYTFMILSAKIICHLYRRLAASIQQRQLQVVTGALNKYNPDATRASSPSSHMSIRTY